MFDLRDQVLPVNRGYVDYYLRQTWGIASELAKSLQAPVTTIPDYAEEKFKEYVQYEEDRIRKNLSGIKYDIDALETVYGVVGPGRIEKVRPKQSWTQTCDAHNKFTLACSHPHVSYAP